MVQEYGSICCVWITESLLSTNSIFYDQKKWKDQQNNTHRINVLYIYLRGGLIFMVHVDRYTIHWSYGIWIVLLSTTLRLSLHVWNATALLIKKSCNSWCYLSPSTWRINSISKHTIYIVFTCLTKHLWWSLHQTGGHWTTYVGKKTKSMCALFGWEKNPEDTVELTACPLKKTLVIGIGRRSCFPFGASFQGEGRC